MATRRRAARRVLIAAALLVLLSGCATRPPDRTDDLCAVFDHEPSWYDHARAAEQRWGTPVAVQMAFVNQESTFRHDARPPRTWLWGFIPWRRASSAYGYAQAQDPVWSEYMAEEGSLFARRTHMKYATDFIGWYNDRTHRRLGISRDNARHLYYAYHEGHTGYRRGNHRGKPHVIRAAQRVEQHASNYQAQLERCEERFQCRRFWQIGPFCDA